MKIALIYDSIYGNTARIAETVAAALKERHTVQMMTVQEARGLDLADVDLLIVGSPTRGFRPTPMISEYVEGLGSAGVGKKAAAFDTRLDLETVEPAPLRWVIDVGGYAAKRVAASLERDGFTLSDTAGFLVSGTEGPLKAGELERAASWGLSLAG